MNLREWKILFRFFVSWILNNKQRKLIVNLNNRHYKEDAYINEINESLDTEDNNKKKNKSKN